MKIKFITSYAEPDNSFRPNHEYDFIDARKANYFIDQGLAIPVEKLIEALQTFGKSTKGKQHNGKLDPANS